MDIQDLLKDIQHLTDYQINQRLEHLINTNSHFSHLSSDNKRLVMKLLDDYKSLVRRGIAVTEEKIHRDTYNLYQKRLSLKLTQDDLNDIKKILEAFRA